MNKSTLLTTPDCRLRSFSIAKKNRLLETNLVNKIALTITTAQFTKPDRSFNDRGSKWLSLRYSLYLLCATFGFLIIAPSLYAICENGCGTTSQDTYLGEDALRNNTTGYYNTAAGYEALDTNSSGNNNTATGFEALVDNSAGSYNTAAGSQALASNTTGFSNTATGAQHLVMAKALPTVHGSRPVSVILDYPLDEALAAYRAVITPMLTRAEPWICIAFSSPADGRGDANFERLSSGEQDRERSQCCERS